MCSRYIIEVFIFSTQNFVYLKELSGPILKKSECENILNEVSGASGQSWHQFLCVGDGKGTVSISGLMALKNICKIDTFDIIYVGCMQW